MLPNEDIIPITYVRGTGGNFLCHYIVSAKRNIQDVIELSQYGNAHENCLKDIFGPPDGIPQPDIEKINFILNQLPYKDAGKPYYTSAHLSDINLINANFKRSIRITYDLNDCQEISTIFYGKFTVNNHDTSINNIKSQTLSYIKLGPIKWQPQFAKIENMPNILFISWKELFKGNIDELTTRISIFTNIDPNNFSKKSLEHWRDKTQYCLNTFNGTK